MIIIPLESLVLADRELKRLLSDNVGVKVSEHDASKTINPPYVCWQIIWAQGQEYLSDPSDMTEAVVQIDIYSKSKPENRKIALLLKNAISEHCYIENFTGNELEASDLYRIRLETRWFEDD